MDFNPLNLIKKVIPAKIEIRSLYWVEHGKKMDSALSVIFEAIDNDRYSEANRLIDEFELEFSQSNVPNWIGEMYASIYRAKSMVTCQG